MDKRTRVKRLNPQDEVKRSWAKNYEGWEDFDSEKMQEATAQNSSEKGSSEFATDTKPRDA